MQPLFRAVGFLPIIFNLSLQRGDPIFGRSELMGKLLCDFEGMVTVGFGGSCAPPTSKATARVTLIRFFLVNAVTAWVFLLSRARREVSGFSLQGFSGVMTETNKRLREVECPKCKARFPFHRVRVPHFDSHGFESYVLDCKSCGASFTGVVDPYDGTLLLSATCIPAPRRE